MGGSGGDGSAAATHTGLKRRGAVSGKHRWRSGTVPGVGGAALEAGGEGLSEAAGGQRIDRLIGPVGRGTQLEDCAASQTHPDSTNAVCLGQDCLFV